MMKTIKNGAACFEAIFGNQNITNYILLVGNMQYVESEEMVTKHIKYSVFTTQTTYTIWRMSKRSIMK